MRRLKWAAVGLAATLCVSQASAGWHEFWHRFGLDYARNAAYPEPFNTADKQLVRQHFEITEANGWRLQNTVGDYLFDEHTNTLNRAGQIKINWILKNAPMHRRAVFVLKGDSPLATQQRVAAVQEYLAQTVTDQPLPPVSLTEHEVEGVPGEYMNEVSKKYWETVPPPRLPAASTGGSGSSGGGSGSGS